MKTSSPCLSPRTKHNQDSINCNTLKQLLVTLHDVVGNPADQARAASVPADLGRVAGDPANLGHVEGG